MLCLGLKYWNKKLRINVVEDLRHAYYINSFTDPIGKACETSLFKKKFVALIFANCYPQDVNHKESHW